MRHASHNRKRGKAADIIFVLRDEARRVNAALRGRYDELTLDAALDRNERMATPRELASLRGGR
ncbi:MAG: hypothetical protein EBQ89_00265 [Alphaproteobacteria bacterium]|nr:hypothetical protein [Alphaproteobacteria bacterium]